MIYRSGLALTLMSVAMLGAAAESNKQQTNQVTGDAVVQGSGNTVTVSPGVPAENTQVIGAANKVIVY